MALNIKIGQKFNKETTVQKQIFVLFIILAFATLTGCTVEKTAAAATQPCKLDFTVKSILITGDKDNYLTRALRTELYKFGVKPDKNGVEIIGNVKWGLSTSKPWGLSVEVPTLAFSASVDPIGGMYDGPDEMVKKMVVEVGQQFCSSAVATSQPPAKTKP